MFRGSWHRALRYLICGSNVSFVSEIKPRNSAYFTNWIWSLPFFKTGSMHFLSGQKCLATVLFLEIVKPFLRVHFSNLLIVCCNFLWIASRDLYIIIKSSTQREHSTPGSTCFTITLNKMVDKIAPYGTPSSWWNILSDIIVPKWIWKVLSDKKLPMKMGKFPWVIPYYVNFWGYRISTWYLRLLENQRKQQLSVDCG